MMHVLLLLLLLIASPAMADPLTVLSGSLTVNAFGSGETSFFVTTSQFTGGGSDSAFSGNASGALGTVVQVALPEYGGHGAFTYQGVLYGSENGFSAPGVPAQVFWHEDTTVNVTLGLDTAPATMTGTVSFPTASFGFVGTGTAHVFTQVNQDQSIFAHVDTITFSDPVPEPATWLLLLTGLGVLLMVQSSGFGRPRY